MLASYLARLSLSTVHGLRGPSLRLLEPATLPMRVWPTDLDTYGHVNNGRYLTLMDQGRWDHALRCGFVREAFRKKWRPMAAAASIRFRRELRIGQRFELVTRICAWDARRLHFEQRFERAGELCAVGHVSVVVKQGRDVVSIPELVSAFGERGDSPPVPRELEALRSGRAASP